MSATSRHDAPREHKDRADAAIDQAFAFFREALVNPEILDRFPDRATLNFREVDIHGHLFQLTAARETGSAEWVALPSRYAPTVGALVFQRPFVDSRGMGQETPAFVDAYREHGTSAESVLDALEARLRTVIAEAVRTDLGKIEGRCE